jgi:hypothetical protein
MAKVEIAASQHITSGWPRSQVELLITVQLAQLFVKVGGTRVETSAWFGKASSD